MSQESEVDQPPQPAVAQPPEVDELGYPTNELPKEPITNFSWRAFFTSNKHITELQVEMSRKTDRFVHSFVFSMRH
jgi:hypothetical protein